MLKKLLLTFMMIQSTLTVALAGPLDVVPKKFKHGSQYVKVTKLANQRVKFENCYKGYESTCANIGRKQSYSLKELTKQRDIENRELAGVIALDAGLVVGAIYTGGALAGAAYGAQGTVAVGYGSSIMALLESLVIGTGGSLGGMGSIGTIGLIDGLNPVYQLNQARSINSNILNDELVEKNDIKEYIAALESVLEKIP